MKKNTKKFIFATVPIGTPYFPEMSIPSLVSQLRFNGYDVDVMDLNIDFLREIYTKEYILDSIETVKKQYDEIQSSENKVVQAYKYEILNDFFENHSELVEKVPNSIEKAVQIIDNENLFYNPKLLQFAHKMIHYANKIACLPYAPFDFFETFETYYDDLCKIIFDEKQNIFIKYFESKIEKIKNINPDYVGISITYRQQVIAGLTFAYLLKKYTNAHINIGGAYISRLTEYIPCYKDFFEKFVDTISFGDGENSIIELAKYIDEKIEISEVPQIIYKDAVTGRIITNDFFAKVSLSKIQMPDYSDYDLKKYFIPEKVLPLQVQRGCYWNTCAFCSFSHSKMISLKKMSSVVEELKYNLKTYGVSTYMLVDEAITPKILGNFADEIIKNKLNLRFFVHVKLEKDFDYKLLKKLYDAGFRNMWWGLESANERVQKLMNKGISIDNVPSILKNSEEIGILNSLYLMCGFPTATYEEDMETYNFLKKHGNQIHYFLISRFVPSRYSNIYDNQDKYKIEIRKDDCSSRISLEYEYDRLEGATHEQIFKILDKFLHHYYNDKFKYIFAPYYYIMYTKKYGLKYVKETLLKKVNFD